MGRKILGKVVATINGYNSVTITADQGMSIDQTDDNLNLHLDYDSIKKTVVGQIPVNPDDTSEINLWVVADPPTTP